jgi:type I restriction enzyme S subunit
VIHTGLLPAGWAFAPLGEIGEWNGGGTPSKENLSFWQDGSIPWVSPKDMKVPVIADSIDHITENAVDQSATKLIEAGSVLFVTRSGILAHTLPVARTVVRVTVNQEIKALTPARAIDPSYVAWCARAFGPTILERCSKDGTTVASIDTERLHAFVVPVAPLREQHRIVDAIESYTSRLDGVEATLERVQLNLERYRASVLKAAVEGRLVPTEAELARAEERSYEPASVLLERILAERRRQWEETELAKMKASGRTPTNDEWKSRYEQPFLPDELESTALPDGWCWASMDQLTSRITSGSRDWTKYYGSGDAVFLMAQNVRPGRLDLSYTQLVDPPPDDPSRERSQVSLGDLLVTIVGANTGDVCRVPNELPQHYVCQSVALMRPVEELTSFYVEAYLNSPLGQQTYERFMYGQGRPHLSFDNLRATPIPLPPLKEQVRIIESVERLQTVVQAATHQVTLDEERCRLLRQSVLKWAFEGRLVDQDPADEPASVLLERIRAERAAPNGPDSPRPARAPRPSRQSIPRDNAK